jgi:hypothetical protein
MDWRGLLRQPFVYDAQRGEANKRIVAVARWFLEFSRNLMVVAVLVVIATKSGQWYVYAFAILAGFALWSTVYFYIDPIVPNPVPGRNGSINFLLITVGRVLDGWQRWCGASVADLQLHGRVTVQRIKRPRRGGRARPRR